MKVLAIDPGSTSTKIGLYEDDREVFRASVEHRREELDAYPTVAAQYPLRLGTVRAAIDRSGIEASGLSAIAGRGGHLPPLRSGARVPRQRGYGRTPGEPPRDGPRREPGRHPGLPPRGAPRYPGLHLRLGHGGRAGRHRPGPPAWPAWTGRAPTTRSTAAPWQGSARPPSAMRYEDADLIVAHLGGGISIGVHRHGRIVDIVRDDEGPFSPRAGRPAFPAATSSSSATRPTGRDHAEEAARRWRGSSPISAPPAPSRRRP